MPFTPPANLDAFAGKIIRAEAPIIRHNTGLRGRMTITCGTTRCTIRAYSRTTDRLAFKLRLRYRPVARHAPEMFEDYSGYVRTQGRTWLLTTIGR